MPEKSISRLLLKQAQFSAVLICCLTYILAGCELFDNAQVGIEEDFVRIYNIDSDASFQALDVEELPDEGYLMFGARSPYPA